MTIIAQLKSLIKMHAETNCHLSQFEKSELAALLLRRDIGEQKLDVLNDFFNEHGFQLLSAIAAYMYDENGDEGGYVLDEINTLVSTFYENEMNILIEEAREEFKQECAKQNPKDEYDPNSECSTCLEGIL